MLIERRFCGPPESGNGGYTAGLLAAELGDAAEVTLRKPPPLDTELVVRRDDGGLELLSGDEVIATARPAEVDALPAAWTSLRGEYPGFQHHPFPSCYVCGPDRPDGLQIFPGRVGDGLTSAPWRVPATVNSATVWAALDCPGGWTIQLEERPSVLGRIAVRIDALPDPGTECLVVGELRGIDGRKAFPVTSLYGPSGELLAVARATWIALGS